MVCLWSKKFQATQNVNTDFFATWALKKSVQTMLYLEFQLSNTMSFIKTDDVFRYVLLSFCFINPSDR